VLGFFDSTISTSWLLSSSSDDEEEEEEHNDDDEEEDGGALLPELELVVPTRGLMSLRSWHIRK
jgi:hypothetical protein